MVTLVKVYNVLNDGTKIGKACGLSTDTKPTTLGNGSEFIEIDTSKLYIYDGDSEDWIEQGSSST